MRNVYVLSLAQALSAAGMMTIFLLGGIIGSELAPLPQIATLPVSLHGRGARRSRRSRRR